MSLRRTSPLNPLLHPKPKGRKAGGTMVERKRVGDLLERRSSEGQRERCEESQGSQNLTDEGVGRTVES